MFKLFSSILVTPSEGWKAAESFSTKRDVMLRYALPMLLLVGVCAFCGTLLKNGSFAWQDGLKLTVHLMLTFFISFYLTAILIKGLYHLVYKDEMGFEKSLMFTVFAYSCVVCVSCIGELFEDMFFIGILHLYTFYIVFVGCEEYLKTSKEARWKTAFIALSSAIIILCPIILRALIAKAMPGIN